MRMLLERHVTRRSILRSIGCAGLALTAAGAKDKPSGKATAFALCGDESHNSDYIRSALTSTLTEDAGLSIDFTDEEKLLSYDSLRHYKILIMFRDGLRFPNGYWHQVYWNEKKNKVSSPRESHPEALSEPCLNVSAHTAPAMEPRRTPICQCAHNFGSRLEIRATQ